MPISLDPDEYPDPKRFYPERFLNEDLDKPLAGHWSLGMGRRGKIPRSQSLPYPILFSLLSSLLLSSIVYINPSLRGLRPRNAKSLDRNLPNSLLLQRLIRRG